MTQVLETPFGNGLVVAWDERVLEPRPWTAMQSRWAAELLGDALDVGRDDLPVLELCSGAGHIGLLAVQLTGRRLVAVDVSEPACVFMRNNSRRAGLADLVEVRQAPMDDALADGERFALVLADPPWVTSDTVGRFPDDPLLAIDGGDDGLAVARLCVEVAGRHVVPGGSLLLQLGDAAQAEALSAEAGDRWRPEGHRCGEGGVVLRLVRSEQP
ncbi:hypothetical protein GCM10023340_10170 [Nocardioides marinquilinus]|uniref:Methyltransferase n=1 Tax=Nocardioides marinquilinus TaxID=1210400 RepID=A0ABP9PEI6_9ACTN